MDIREERYRALKKVHKDFANIINLDRCRTCACFYADMMASILEAVKTYRNKENSNRLANVEKDFDLWLREAADMDLHK